MKLLGSTEYKLAEDKNDENVPHPEITEVVLVHCVMIINKIQESCIHLFQKTPFRSLLEISPTNHIFLKTFNSEYNEIKVQFTDQNSQPLEINLTMVIK